MNLGIIILAVFLVPAIVIGSVLLWNGTDALLHGGEITRDVGLALESLGRALRSTYDSTARESLPDDFLHLLGQLTNRWQQTQPSN